MWHDVPLPRCNGTSRLLLPDWPARVPLTHAHAPVCCPGLCTFSALRLCPPHLPHCAPPSLPQHDGAYDGFDPNEFPSRSGGKREAVQHIKKARRAGRPRQARCHAGIRAEGTSPVLLRIMQALAWCHPNRPTPSLTPPSPPVPFPTPHQYDMPQLDLVCLAASLLCLSCPLFFCVPAP